MKPAALKPHHQTELLHIIWTLRPETEYLTPEGENISVLGHGEYDEKKGRFCGAKIRCGENIYYGDIVIWTGDEHPPGDYESTILHITPLPSARILRHDGQPVLQVIHTPDPLCAVAYGELKQRSTDESRCSRYVSSFERHDRIALFTRLMVDRLHSKYTDVMEIFHSCEQNWNETLYVYMMRAMGSPKNKEAFTELARRVGFKHICKEKSSVINIEALLLGASGLLELYEEDEYIRKLKETFDHFCGKHSIVPMRHGQWNLNSNNVQGKPVLRLAQMSTFFFTRDFMFDKVTKCKTVAQLQEYFDVEASMYWSTRYNPGEESNVFRPKRLGHERANVMGINFVVPTKFAYGVYMGDETLKEEALDLLEKINPENNTIVHAWRKGGTVTENAFDSQAVIELNNSFCKSGLCWRCPVGKRAIKEVYRSQSAQKV